MKVSISLCLLLAASHGGFSQEWRTPIAVDIPASFNINLRGIPSRCYKVVRPADGRITAQVVGPGQWNVCVGDQGCPYDCMSGSRRQVSTEPLTAGTHYFVMVERKGSDAMATLLINPTVAGRLPNARAVILGAWTAVIPNKNFRRGGYRIAQSGSKLSLFRPDGNSSSAYYLNDSTIVAEQWKANGTIRIDGKRIDWDNGGYWESAGGGVPNARAAILGTWTAVVPNKNWRRGGYKIVQNGSKLTLVSWDGATSSAYFLNDSTIVAEEWKGTGTIRSDGKRIDWGNGSWWER